MIFDHMSLIDLSVSVFSSIISHKALFVNFFYFFLENVFEVTNLVCYSFFVKLRILSVYEALWIVYILLDFDWARFFKIWLSDAVKNLVLKSLLSCQPKVWIEF